MLRMLLIGYCFSIRSERRLCREVRLNLAYRWFCRLGIEDEVPDHSTFSVNRHGRYRQSDILRRVFEEVVRRCMMAGLVGGEGFAVDASVIEADASRFKRVDGGEIRWTDAEQARWPVRAYLAALDGGDAPTTPERAPKVLSPTDPAAAWTTRGRHRVMFGYSLNYLIDTETAVIVDVEATPTRISEEVDATETMIERTKERFGLKPDTVAADVAYGTGEMLGWLVERNIDPHIPVWERSRRTDETFPRSAFAYERERDLYICPGGKTMKTTGRVHDGKTLLYRASKRDCDVCLLKAQCCPTTPSRKIPRDVNEDARNHARALMESEAFQQSGRRRKKIETLFGDAKRNLGLSRLQLRGLAGARDEFLLTAIVQNLKRLVCHVAIPPPAPRTA
jgi:IS5 family transposase